VSGSRLTRELPAIRTIEVPGGRVTISPGMLESVGVLAAAAVPTAHRWAVVADDAVAAAHGHTVRASFADPPTWHEFRSGEQHKTRETWGQLTDSLAASGHGRDSAVLALGGGVAGDLAGFVAATYARGIPVVQVPTSLLAMVDASVGGKTAVDIPAGKNLVGAFHPPSAVLADPMALATLPEAERRAGVAEMLKHGIVADAAHAAHVLELLPALIVPGREHEAAVTTCLAASVQVKATIVADDPQEHGRRAVLNFGHTVAHAVELVTGYAVRHGEAVAIGLVVEAAVAERLGVAEAGTASAIRDMVHRAGLPSAVPAGVSAEALLLAMRLDKKARQGGVRCALPACVGAMAMHEGRWTHPVPDAAWSGLLGQ
jgi:3-dehydroquinate synthase